MLPWMHDQFRSRIRHPNGKAIKVTISLNFCARLVHAEPLMYLALKKNTVGRLLRMHQIYPTLTAKYVTKEVTAGTTASVKNASVTNCGLMKVMDYFCVAFLITTFSIVHRANNELARLFQWIFCSASHFIVILQQLHLIKKILV